MVFSARDASATPDPYEHQLDADIQSIRAEIHALQRRKRFLASSLLASDSIQKLMRKPSQALTSIQDEVSPLVRAAGKHSESNHHRIAFGATAFPFKDPSPIAPAENLLGVRIDVCVRGGRFSKPYYVLLRRERMRGETVKRLRVYRHTIPAFIDIVRLEKVYLPFVEPARAPGEEGNSDGDEEDHVMLKVGKSARKQDLRGFVRELRRELMAWHLRGDAVELLREKLGLSEESYLDPAERLSPESRGGIVALAPTTIEARYVRLEWDDGRVGRFKLSNTGLVERAVVIGDDGRVKHVENAMTGGGGRVETLLERLNERGAEA